MTPKTTWIVIANGTRARFLESADRSVPPRELAEEELTWSHKKSQEIVSDRPGRSHESVGTARHAVEPRSNPERELARQFAVEISAHLEKALRGGLYQRLVVVAGPALLGDLRAALPEPVRKAVTGEHAKDLTHLPFKDLIGQVSEML